MANNGKWISDLDATTPLPDAARRVLTVRLDVVRHHLPLALDKSDEDPEHIHQLRVSTRRAGAALKIVALCLPRKVYKTARNQLRQLRRAAGEVRDWDVFLEALPTDEATAKERPALDFLTGYALGRREAGHEQLREVSADSPFALDRLLAETVAAVHKPHGGSGDRTLGGWARSLLGDLLRELDQAAAGDLDDYRQLHQVRIAGKRLRYAMEIFADCFAPAFREELYPQVEEMQEILGDANDSHVAVQHLETVRDRLRAMRPDDWKRYRPGIEKWLRYHQRRLPRERHRFLQWWQRWQESGAEETLAGLLKTTTSAAS
jgi:CHAD domain-containing protein